MLVSLLAVLATSGGVTASAIRSRAPAAAASAWASSNDGRYKLSEFDAPALGAANDGSIQDWDFKVLDKSGARQTVRGFGACVTDGTVTVINQLPDDARRELLQDIMTSSGLNFNLMRHTVASSDLSGDPAYTYDDNGGNEDRDMAGFGLGDRGQAMAKMLAEMKGLQSDMVLLGSPWAPPGWMQQDKAITKATNGQPNKLDHQYDDAFGKYFVKYIQEYEKLGAHIDAITIQNEPLNDRYDMPTLKIEADESGALVRDHVGPALRDAGLDTGIWAFDHNTQDYYYPQTVSQAAGDLVSAAAWHCYSGNDAQNWQPLSKYHDEFPNQEQYMTECWTATGTTDWVHSSNFNLLPLQNWANGIIAWGLGTYAGGGPSLSGDAPCHQCTGLVTVDPDAGTWSKTIDYYMMGQFSRFMAKGGKVLDGTGSYLFDDGGLYSVSSLNPDGTRTVVIQNRYDHDVFVKVTTESEDQSWNGRVVGNAVTTWVLPKV